MHPKPKKRLGQHFLIDQNIQRKIVDLCELEPTDTILEIGAGRGELTKLIADKVKKIYALELDSRFCKTLKERLRVFSNVEIINQDILKFNLKKCRGKVKKRIKVIGNIPYNISTPIIEHLINFKDNIDTILITVQREFARRMAVSSGSKEYGALSCFVQYYLEPKIILSIKKTCFSPQPKVDSCLIKLGVRQKPKVSPKSELLFFQIIRASFNQRRKTLRNSLKDIIPLEKLGRFFVNYGIDSNTRPERLSLEDFANLSDS